MINKNDKEMKQLDHYILFSQLLEYPKEPMNNKALQFAELVKSIFPEHLAKAELFLDEIENKTLKEQQEYYMNTFDVKAITHLDIGYLIFGEDYKRAEFLVNLQKEHHRAGIDCGSELGDHLPNILKLIAKTTNKEFAEELGFIITTPSVRFMINKFKDHNNYYTYLLEVIVAFLQTDFKGENLKEFEFAEERITGDHEFMMPSPKTAICQTNCKHKRN